jgi:pSer/pThr/pTyr-binding forkhead associated (FHA) protein
MDVKLIITEGARRAGIIALRSEETIIGRMRGCDLRIPSSEVSRRHCRLSFRDGCLMLEDLASANGSFLNGVAVAGQQLVRPGDLLRVGPVTFRVEYPLATSAVEQVVQESPAGGPAPEVVPLLEEAELLEEVEPAADEKPRKRKKKKKHKEEPVVNFDDLSWQAPAGEDLRDILSQLGDE